MEAESNPSAQTSPGGSSPSLPGVATAVAVAAANDSSHTEGDAAHDRDGDNECQCDVDITPPQGPRPGDGSGQRQTVENESITKRSSAADSNNHDIGCSAGAKSDCGVASGRMYDFSDDNSDTLMSIGTREGQASLLNSDSDGDNDERYTHSRKDGDDIHVEAKQSTEGDGEENNEESSRHETEHESLFEDDGLFMNEQVERNNGQRRNYLPPAPEVYEMDDGIGGNAVSKTRGDQIDTHSFGPVGKLEQGLSLMGAYPSPPGALEDMKKTDSGLDFDVLARDAGLASTTMASVHNRSERIAALRARRDSALAVHNRLRSQGHTNAGSAEGRSGNGGRRATESGNGEFVQDESFNMPSAAAVNASSNNDGSSEAESIRGVTSSRAYQFLKGASDNHERMGARERGESSFDSDSVGNNDEDYSHETKEGNGIDAKTKWSAESDEENDMEDGDCTPHLDSVLDEGDASKSRNLARTGSSTRESEVSVFNEATNGSLAENDGLDAEYEEAKTNNGETRNYLPPAPEVYKAHGGGIGSSGLVGKLEQSLSQVGADLSPADVRVEGMETDAGLDQELRKSMQLAGLEYSGKAPEKSKTTTFMLLKDNGLPEKVPPTAPKPPTDSTLMKVMSGVPLASKGVGPETVDAPGPREEGFAMEGTADMVLLESEGPRPEIVAAPGPNVEPSRMVALSSPRGMINIDMQVPMQGLNLPEGSAGGGGKEDSAQQMPSALPGAVAVPGPMLHEGNTDGPQGEEYSNYATATPFDASIVMNEEMSGQSRQQGGRVEFRPPALDPNEIVYDGITEDKDGQPQSWWNCLSTRYKWMYFVGLLLVLFLAVAIGVPVALRTGQDSISTTSFTPKSRFSIKAKILEAAEIHAISSTANALNDEESPQHMALEWLVLEDEQILDFDNTKRLVQRFALASFYFATGGNESWNKQHKFLTNTISECNWRGDNSYQKMVCHVVKIIKQ